MSITESRTQAETILAQLGGRRRLSSMAGAKGYTFSADGGVSFRIGRNAKRVNVVRITLDQDDTYSAAFVWSTVHGETPRFYSRGVYADMLRPTFERATGMYLSL